VSSKQYIITGIFKNPDQLEKAYEALKNQSFSHHDVVIQEDPQVLKKVIGESYLKPSKIQKLDKSIPHKPLVTTANYGWLYEIIMSLTMVVFVVSGLLIFWSFDSIALNYLLIAVFGAVGLCLGGWVTSLIERRKKIETKVFKKGGKVLHINAQKEKESKLVKSILAANSAYNIKSKKAA
jgi:hypothetical protein